MRYILLFTTLFVICFFSCPKNTDNEAFFEVSRKIIDYSCSKKNKIDDLCELDTNKLSSLLSNIFQDSIPKFITINTLNGEHFYCGVTDNIRLKTYQDFMSSEKTFRGVSENYYTQNYRDFKVQLSHRKIDRELMLNSQKYSHVAYIRICFKDNSLVHMLIIAFHNYNLS